MTDHKTVTYFHCPYCTRPVPSGCPDPSQFVCCGEKGHVEVVEVDE